MEFILVSLQIRTIGERCQIVWNHSGSYRSVQDCIPAKTPRRSDLRLREESRFTYAARPSQDVRVVRIVESFAGDAQFAEFIFRRHFAGAFPLERSVRCVQLQTRPSITLYLNVNTVRSTIVALNHFRFEGVLRRSTNALDLRNGRHSSRLGALAALQRQRLNIAQKNLLVLIAS